MLLVHKPQVICKSSTFIVTQQKRIWLVSSAPPLGVQNRPRAALAATFRQTVAKMSNGPESETRNSSPRTSEEMGSEL